MADDRKPLASLFNQGGTVKGSGGTLKPYKAAKPAATTAKPKAPATPTQKVQYKSRFHPGAVFGEFTLLQRIKKVNRRSPQLNLCWRVRCSCGKRLTVPEHYFRRRPNPKTHCGCLARSIKTENPQEFTIWCMMHQRCQFEHFHAYHHYGGRGIRICDRWNRQVSGDEGFTNFLNDVGKRPGPEFSIDRINNDGNYEPDNVRWATAKQQAQNRRTNKGYKPNTRADDDDDDDEDGLGD